MSETKAAFAERAIQSIKHITYRYIENHGKIFSQVTSIFIRRKYALLDILGDVKRF